MYQLSKDDRLFLGLKQMVSKALRREMETCCTEDLIQPEVRDKLSDGDSLKELRCGNPCGKEQADTDVCAEKSKGTEGKPSPRLEQESRKTECKERKKLKETNSWKMVRFQDPSTEDDVSEWDSSAEILFPEYAVEEWTTTSFKELFAAEDWKNVTGETSTCNRMFPVQTLELMSVG